MRVIVLSLMTLVGALVPGPVRCETAPLQTQSADAPAPAQPAVPFRRGILALYDGRSETELQQTRIHKFAEMPLNHLGYTLTYHDISTGLPDAAAIARHGAVLTWFLDPLPNADAYLSWLDRATQAGLRYVALGVFAPPEPPALLNRLNRVLQRIGLQHTGDYVDVTYRAEVKHSDPGMIGFERPIDRVVPDFPRVVLRGGGANPHLTIDLASRSDARHIALVTTGERGGFAAQNFTIAYDSATERVRWILNPFAFFRQALGNERFPIPDTTTVSGRRLYFSHIDGDGWNNISEVEGYREALAYSSEVVERELIMAYPDLPVTVGVISCDIDSEHGGSTANAAIARRLFALEQVEVGSHTHSHPFNWEFFEHYDRSRETALIERYQRPKPKLRERVNATLLRLARKDAVSAANNPYIAMSDDLPRTYMLRPFDLGQEVRGALLKAQSLAPQGKRALLYQWSGDTNPFEAAVRAVRLSGARNINGGDSRLDSEYPSVAYVPPIGRPVGNERQIYAVNSNENTYTNDWTGPYFGYFNLEQTLNNTERPRRLKGFNVYYHMYSGEKPSALAAVRYFLDKARSSPVAPIAASHYADIAEGFYATEIVPLGPDTWRVARRGALQTVRFDAGDELAIDLRASRGVLGGTRHAGSLYVALDPAVSEAVVALRRAGTVGGDGAAGGRESAAGAGGPGSAEASSAPADALLIGSRWRISGLERKACGFALTAEGFGPGEMMWETGRPPRAYRISASRAGRTLWQQRVETSEQGMLAFSVGTSAIRPLNLEVACDD